MPLCSSPKDIECVTKINVDDSDCLVPCSGFLVTGYKKSDHDENLKQDTLPMIEAYNRYKKITQIPSGFNGNYVIVYVDTSYELMIN